MPNIKELRKKIEDSFRTNMKGYWYEDSTWLMIDSALNLQLNGIIKMVEELPEESLRFSNSFEEGFISKEQLLAKLKVI